MNVFTYNVTIICDHKVISIISVLMFHLSLCFWYLVIIFRRLEFDTTPKIIFFIIHDHKIGLPLLVTLFPSIYSFTISILVFAEASYYDGIWVQFADKMHDFGGKVIFILYFKVFRYSFFFFFSLSDRYKIFTCNSLWIEICENVVLSKIDITMTTTNKKLWNWYKPNFVWSRPATENSTLGT